MDKFKDILNSIRDRISNPLIFSFLLSWLITNWQITLAIIWHDVSQIEKAGYKSIFDFVSDKINSENSFWIPLGCALGYTFLIPITRNFINAFYSWISKWGENWNLKILKGGKIPIEKYFGLREVYTKRSEMLEQVISQESTAIVESTRLKTELLNVNSENNNMKMAIANNERIMNLFRDVKVLNGYWINSYKSADSSFSGSEEVYINDGAYYLFDSFGKKIHTFNIINFYFDSRYQSIYFVKETISTQDQINRYIINDLRVENEQLLIGKENGSIEIKYTKKDSDFVVSARNQPQ